MGQVFTEYIAFRDQKRVLESLELELETGSSELLSVWLGIKLESLTIH